MMACTVHGLTVQVLPWDRALLKTLWESGRAMTNGGAAAGVLAQALVQGRELVIGGGDFVLCTGEGQGCGCGHCHKKRGHHKEDQP